MYSLLGSRLPSKLTAMIATCALACVMATPARAAFNTNPPTTGAYDSNAYRNLFSEIGKTNTQQKLDNIFQKMFYGTDNEKLYYRFNDNEYYIWDTGSNDIRSEGQSWGMMIAVQMNKQDEFNKLWRFAYNRMRQSNGTFAWQLSTNGAVLDSNSAPDGDEYFAAALFCAAYRWGNSPSDSLFHYENHANDILKAMKTYLFHPQQKQVVFSPVGKLATYTDPSYHLPAFYEYWADVASQDNTYWSEVAVISRDFLSKHIHSTTGLSTYFAWFSGPPRNSDLGFTPHVPGDIYMADAWRVAMNVGMDAHLFGAEPWQKNATNNLYNFFRNQEGFNSGGICGNGYSQYYTYAGADWGTCNQTNWRHDVGQIGANAAAAFASTKAAEAQDFLNDLWNASWPTGTYRYYNGCLHMLGLLHASGQFKLYKPSPSSFTTPVRVEIRAQGTSGSERLELRVNNAVVRTYTMSTRTRSFVYDNFTGGNIKLRYINDAAGRDIRVYHINVNSLRFETESQASNSAVYQNGSCGGSYSEWMNCNGEIDFGNF